MNLDELTLGQVKQSSFLYVKEWFEKFGYKVLDEPSLEDNSCDMYVVGEKRALLVEIKSVRQLDNGTWQAGPVSKNQHGCSVCAVVFPNGNVFVEKMSDYLQHCSTQGYRQFTFLKL